VIFGDDGRLLTLFVHDDVGQLLTSLALEEKLNRLLDAGNQAMRLSRSEFWATLDDFPPPQH
jgi:hypothetical protein